MNSVVKWSLAIGLSLLAHAGGAAFLRPDPEEVLVAGGEITEIALLGNAFDDAVEAGDPEVIDPVEEIEPVEEEIPAETVDAIQPTIADVAVPLDALPPVVEETPMVTAAISPVEEIKPVEEPEEKPIPEKKPEPEPEKKVEKKPEPKPKPKKVVRKKPGEKVDTQQNARKGKADGRENGTSVKATGTGRAAVSEVGNAAVSNYPGKVRSKLSRATRTPAAAKREKLRGTATVSFTVNSSGGVSGIRLSRSAGSSLLDEAALAIVARAAPFPKIPQGSGRSTWAFNVPIRFN